MNYHDIISLLLTSALVCTVYTFLHVTVIATRLHRYMGQAKRSAKQYAKQYDNCETWLHHGYEMGWCTPPVCLICDGIPMSDNEGRSEDPPCIHGVRLYEDREIKAAVEEDHAPSVWRATNRGWERK